MSQELERVYTINLGKVLLSPDNQRAKRAINMVKEFARHHMKTQEIKIEGDLNQIIWERGIRHPPRKIRVRMTKTDEGHIIVSPYEETEEKPKSEKETKKKDTKKTKPKEEITSKEEIKEPETKVAEVKEETAPKIQEKEITPEKTKPVKKPKETIEKKSTTKKESKPKKTAKKD
ncbi:MAG TPA: 50S ribosomal protein L31e [Nitrosopumilaceae archaeon]|nr:50S ribosomal protein L31e [Nitrosopumilaceae archaeon]